MIDRPHCCFVPPVSAHLRFRHQRSFHRRCLRIHQSSPLQGHTLEAMRSSKADIEELQSKIELLREEVSFLRRPDP